MRKTDFTKFINSLDEDELKKELVKLYDKHKDVKEYYTMELGSDKDREKLLEKAKTAIGRLYERRRTRSRITKTNKILKDIEAISIFDHELADVFLHHAEAATQHINYWGWVRNPDLPHLEKSFKKAVDLVTVSQSRKQYELRLKGIIAKLHAFPYFADELEIYLDDNLI